MPGTGHTERIGKFNNEVNRRKFSQQKEQELLNRIAGNMGQTLMEEGLRSPIGWLYFLSIVQNLQMPPEGRPMREIAVQETSAAFEANTVVQTKREGEQLRIDSFLSSSTVNTTRVSQPTPLNQTERNGTAQEASSGSANHVNFLAHGVHELSLELHKLVYGIKELSNCTTEKNIFQVGETIEKTHFNTICQNATAKSNQVNKQDLIQSEEIKHFSFKGSSEKKKGTTDSFSSEEAAQILRKKFQAFFEKEHKQSPDANDNGTNQRSSFWENLNETVSSFFSQFEQAAYPEQQAGMSGGSIMDSFLSMMKQALSSINYENQASYDQRMNHSQTTKSTKIIPSESESEPSTSEQKESVLKEDEVSFLTKLSHLTSELATTLDGFVERMVSPLLGAEATLLSEPATPTETTSIDEQADRTVSPTIDPETNQVHELNETIVNNRIPSNRYQEPLPIFFYNHDLFQRKNETSNVNKKLKEFFIKEKIANDTTLDVELLDIAQKWIGNKELDKLERKQFLTYLILNHYGVENVRWGEFVSASNSRNLFLQWQANTLLEDYTYKEITDETVQHDLSESESVLVTTFNQYKKESDQLYMTFISDLSEKIPKNHPLSPIYYDETLFKVREKTMSVNEAVFHFLNEQNFSKDIQLPSELVRTLQEWILAGENYDHILQRQRQAGELLCKEYGATIGELSPIQARFVLLQWENNNMQVGYHFREFNGLMVEEQRENGMNGPVKKIDINQKIDTFLHENGIQLATNRTNDSEKKTHLLLDPQQKERQRERIISLLAEKGIVCEKGNPQKLFKEAMHWLLHENENPKPGPADDRTHEETSSETMYVTKIKQFANVLFNKKEDVLSEETASEIVTNWVDETLEELLLEESKESKETLRHAKTSHSPWQSPKLMNQINQFLHKKKLLSNENKSREMTMVALGKWLIPDRDELPLRPDRFQPLAKMILKQLELYGGKNTEEISEKDAEATVMKWVFENVLGTSIERHIAQRIVFIPDPGPSTLSISSLKTHLERSPYDQHHGRLSVEEMRAEGELSFKRLWEIGLERMLPNYLFAFDEPSESNRDISDYEALTQLIGAKLVKHAAYQPYFNESEMRLLVDDFLETTVEEIEKKKVSLEALQIISLPALLTTAQVEPDLLRTALIKGDYMKVSLSVFVSYYKKGYFKLIERQAEIDHLFKDYQNAVLHWRGKSVLANEIVKECYKSGIQVEGNPVPLLPENGSKVTTQQAIDRYLGGAHPCPTAHWKAPDLDEWFNSLTKNVTEASFNLDKKIIPLAFESMEPEEYQFLFSSKTQIYKATSKVLRFSTVDELVESIPLFTPLHKIGELMGIPGLKKKPIFENFELKNTDLFVAKQGEEERVYALKRLENEGGYAVYRVDRNASLYVKYELFGKKFRLTPMDRLIFDVDQTNERFTDTPVQDIEFLSKFISKIAETHRDDLNERLSQSGEAKQMKETSLEMLLSLVPFYDCITEINKGETEKATISCTIDILLLIPLVGEAVALSTKFGLSVARAFLRGGLKNVLRSTRYFIPKATDFARLGISTLRYLDPGVETAVDSSRLLIKSLTRIRNIGKRTSLLEKLESMSAPVSTSFVKANLPKNGPEVLVKQVKDKNLYVRVTNPKTGDAFGEYFLLKNNQLQVFKGPVKFTNEQQQTIHTAAVKIEDNQQFVDGKNANPMAYGEASVRTIMEKDKPNQLLIKMNDQWIPIRETSIEGHGVRYDAVILEQLIPVNYNGMEWYFESATSPFITKKIEKKIGRKLGQFETLSDPSVLSAPDERGLMRDASGRSYIKIKNHYVPLILLDEEVDRYHLVKKKFNGLMRVLRFKSERGQFQFETISEKNEWQKELMNREEKHKTSKIQPSIDGIEIQYSGVGSQGGTSQGGPSQAGTSRGGPSQAGTSRGGPSQAGPSQTKMDQRASTLLPPFVDRSLAWKKIRGGSTNKRQVFRRGVDSIVQAQRIHNFIPTQPIELVSNEKRLRRDFLMTIDDQLKAHPEKDFQVFVGLDTRKSPDFIKSFQVEVGKGIDTARKNFSRMKYICQDLSTKTTLSCTPFDQYVTKMFKLEHITDKVYKENILREINTRLLSIADKGEQILQQTIDFGFENIWIVSKKMIWDKKSKTYLSQLTDSSDDGYVSAFVNAGDPQCKIVILADAFHLDPSLKPGKQLKSPLSTTIIHETTHLGSRTADFVSLSIPPKGFDQSGSDICNNYYKNIDEVVCSKGFENFVDRLAQQQNLRGLSKDAVVKALDSDDMLLANLQIEDAETVATTIRDISEGRDFNQRSRVQRSVDDKLIDNQLGWLFFNFAIGVLFNAEQYWLSPHLNKTHELKETEVSEELDVTIKTDEESAKEATSVKSEKSHVEKRSIVNILKRKKEKNDVSMEKIMNKRLATEHSII
ncbi:QWxxN domain [Enterococcus durans]|uniref:QWxxN domain n=1 Tax=Enterococcus durans TaxID=53345 RepID=UPI0039A6EC5E